MGKPFRTLSAVAMLSQILRLVRCDVHGWSFALVLIASLFGGLAPSAGRAASSESDAPVEETESTGHLAICSPTSLKRGETPAQQPLHTLARRGHASSNPAAVVLPVLSGHRLANGLLAPLRC
jgi:hypothetical protein